MSRHGIEPEHRINVFFIFLLIVIFVVGSYVVGQSPCSYGGQGIMCN